MYRKGEEKMNGLDDPKPERSQWIWFVMAPAAMAIIAFVSMGLPR
jgi:hypothetical protein